MSHHEFATVPVPVAKIYCHLSPNVKVVFNYYTAACFEFHVLYILYLFQVELDNTSILQVIYRESFIIRVLNCLFFLFFVDASFKSKKLFMIQ